MNFLKNRTGQLGGATILVTGLITFLIILIIGTNVVDGIKETQCDDYYNESLGGCFTNSSQVIESRTAGFNVSVDTTDGLSSFSDFSGTVALVLVASIILSLLGGFFVITR